MTEKQIERVKTQIKNRKRLLAADKKKWGGFHHDGQGIRYLLTELFIKIKDYKGGHTYLKWFSKNFPDDSGYPIFLFEWAFILFKCEKLNEAETKLHHTFFSNTYLIDTFLGKEPLKIHKYEGSNWENESLLKDFTYRSTDLEFIEFGYWTEGIVVSQKFLEKANEYLDIHIKLLTEEVGPIRTKLVNRSSEIRYGN
jgi:hypothetical protein